MEQPSKYVVVVERWPGKFGVHTLVKAAPYVPAEGESAAVTAIRTKNMAYTVRTIGLYGEPESRLVWALASELGKQVIPVGELWDFIIHSVLPIEWHSSAESHRVHIKVIRVA